MTRKPKKVTVEELERILDSETDQEIHILPNGSITTRRGKQRKKPKVKVLTLKEALGGEYGALA